MRVERPEPRVAIVEPESRTQVLGTFAGNPTEAATAFRERRAPRWQDM
ncbi:hypothetical protein [Embleya sp. AB8]